MTSPNTGNVTTGPGTLYYAPLGTTEPVTRVAAWPSGWVPVGYTAQGHAFTTSLSVDGIEVAELLDVVRNVTTKRESKVAFAMAEATLAHLRLMLNGGTTTPDSATYTDGTTTNASPTLTLPTAGLTGLTTALDVGKTVSGAGIPPGTTILSVTNSTTAVMSANATAASPSIVIVARYGSYYEPPEVGAEIRAMLGWDSEDTLERTIWRRVLQTGNSEIARRKGADYAKFNAEFSLEQPGGGLRTFRHFFETSRVAA